MSERNTNFGKLTTQEFEQVMNEVAAPDFHDLTTEDFFAAWREYQNTAKP